MPGVSLYIHIPFCIRKCQYCDFVSYPDRRNDFSRYMSCVEDELKDINTKFGKLDVQTAFIGGGTPSILQGDEIMRLVAIVRRYFHVLENAEITIEANPGTVDESKFRDYRASGINRISIGMQSSSERLLSVIGRIHDHSQTVNAVRMAREAGFNNINLDLIYALPTQSMSEWIETLKAALALKPEHLSLYNLILEEGTPLWSKVKSGEFSQQTDEICVEMRAAAGRILSRQGYSRYEISNYSKPGYECRHNIVYWTRGEYVGVGCAAHSFMGGYRYCNTSDIDAYMNGERESSREFIDDLSAREEIIMLGTRMTKGIPLSTVENKKEELKSLKELGLITVSDTAVALTDRGMDVQNAVVLKLI